MSLNVLQQGFLDEWRVAGGVHAPYQPVIHGQFSDHIISVVCKDGVGWVYDHVGERHNDANGVRLEGEVAKALPVEDLEDRLALYSKVSATGKPVKVEEIGITGLSRRSWTSRVYVATEPPPGASAAVVGVCEWLDTCAVLDTDFVSTLVERRCPPWIVEMFHAQDPATMRTRAKILTMISEGDFGTVPDSDLAQLSLAVTQLKNTMELELFPEVA